MFQILCPLRNEVVDECSVIEKYLSSKPFNRYSKSVSACKNIVIIIKKKTVIYNYLLIIDKYLFVIIGLRVIMYFSSSF